MQFRKSVRGLLSTVLAAALMVAAPSVAHAGLESYPAAHVSFNVPDSWSTTTRNGQIVTQSPTPGVLIEFDAVTNAAQVQAGEASIAQMLTRTFQNVAPDGPATAVQQNGLRGHARHGTATRNGVPVFWFAVIVGHPGGGVFAIGIANQAGLAQYRPIITAVLNSIRAS